MQSIAKGSNTGCHFYSYFSARGVASSLVARARASSWVIFICIGGMCALSCTPTHVECEVSVTIDELRKFLSSSSLLLASYIDASSRNLKLWLSVKTGRRLGLRAVVNVRFG